MSDNDKLLKDATEPVPDPATEAGAERRVITDDETRDEGGVLAADDVTTAAIGDAKVNQPPVRSALPDEPVAHGVGVGQGAHTPPADDVFGPDGRVSDAYESDTVKGPGGDGDAQGRVAGPDEPAAEREANPVPDDVSDTDPAKLADAHTADELRDAAEARGLSKSGSKPDLAAALVEHDAGGGS